MQNYISWPFQRTDVKYNLHEIAVCYKFRFVNTLRYILQLVQLHVLVLKFLPRVDLIFKKNYKEQGTQLNELSFHAFRKTHIQLLTLDEETELKINFTLLCRNSHCFVRVPECIRPASEETRCLCSWQPLLMPAFLLQLCCYFDCKNGEPLLQSWKLQCVVEVVLI